MLEEFNVIYVERLIRNEIRYVGGCSQSNKLVRLEVQEVVVEEEEERERLFHPVL